MVILKKLCIYKNLDKMFYACVNVLQGNVFLKYIRVSASVIVSEVLVKPRPWEISEVVRVMLSPKVEIAFGSLTNVLVSDYAQMLRVIVKSVEESFRIESQASMSYAYTMNALTNVGVSDLLSKQITKILSANETVLVSDSLTYTKVKTLTFEEALSVSSTSEIVLRRGIEIREAVVITSEARITYPLVLEAYEDLAVSDVLSKKLVKTLRESVRITSSASLRLRLSASLSIRPSDSLSYVKARFLNANETLSVSDAMSKKLLKSLPETVRVNSIAYISVTEPPRGAE